MTDRILDLYRKATFVLIGILCIPFFTTAQRHNVNRFALTYDSPAENSWGSMVCGNGDISSNVWIDKDGDLQFYIGKTDSRDDVGNLIKISKVTVEFSPSIFKDAVVYNQKFDLQTASFNVTTSRGDLRFWVDANNPEIILSVNSRIPVKSIVSVEKMRPDREEVLSYPVKVFRSPDSLVENRNDDIILFHRNMDEQLFDSTINLYKVLPDEVENPLKNLTWGIQIHGNGFKNISNDQLTNLKPKKKLEIRVSVLSENTDTSEDWIAGINNLSNRLKKRSVNKLYQKHTKWWRNFWDRSYIEISTANPSALDSVYRINRAYYYNRYVMYIASMGHYPIQFNGSTWLVDTYPDTIYSLVGGKISNTNADYRLWGNLILWQNMRIPYWSMLASGDWSSMKSLIDFYVDDVYPMMKLFTQRTLGFEGTLFTEGTMPWGTLNPDIYGWDRSNMKVEDFANQFHQYHYIPSLELINLLLDYYAYTENDIFLKEKILPIAKDVVTYYSKRYEKDERGYLKIFPARSLESFMDCTNPTPTVAGLHFVLPRLVKMATQLGDHEFQTHCQNLFKILPPVPVRKDSGGDVILVAEKAGEHINVEQPDLYAIYPFRLYVVGTPDNEIGRYTFENASFSDTTQGFYKLMPTIKFENGNSRPIFSWNQTGVQAAYLGFDQYAKEILTRSALSNDERFRFPSFFGPNYDWIPDGDHLGVINMTLQSMILQGENEFEIKVLPAWPKEWNVSFKLFASKNSVVEGKYENGKMSYLKTYPKKRLQNIKVFNE